MDVGGWMGRQLGRESAEDAWFRALDNSPGVTNSGAGSGAPGVTGWQPLSDQTRTAAYDPTRDYSYDHPSMVQQMMDPTGRLLPGSSVPTWDASQSKPATQLSSARKIAETMGPAIAGAGGSAWTQPYPDDRSAWGAVGPAPPRLEMPELGPNSRPGPAERPPMARLPFDYPGSGAARSTAVLPDRSASPRTAGLDLPQIATIVDALKRHSGQRHGGHTYGGNTYGGLRTSADNPVPPGAFQPQSVRDWQSRFDLTGQVYAGGGRVGFDEGGPTSYLDSIALSSQGDRRGPEEEDDFIGSAPSPRFAGPSQAFAGPTFAAPQVASAGGGGGGGGPGMGDIMGMAMKLAPMIAAMQRGGRVPMKVGGTLGGVAGGLLGSYFGGPIGGFAGGELGGLLGNLLPFEEGGRVPMMRGGYPELYNAPIRHAFASGGGGRGYVPPDGQGSGRSDHIPADLSPGEFVMDAETTSLLGDGDNEAGARQLEQLRQNIRRHKGKQLAEGKFSPSAKAPEQYMSERLSASDRAAHSGMSDGLRHRGRHG